jgi:hypothetical protein
MSSTERGIRLPPWVDTPAGTATARFNLLLHDRARLPLNSEDLSTAKTSVDESPHR